MKTLYFWRDLLGKGGFNSMGKHKVVIDASNLHGGGGVQVAASFISELAKIDLQGLDLCFVVSSEVHSSIPFEAVNGFSDSYFVDNTYSYRVSEKLRKLAKRADLVFTVFGPQYFNSGAKVNVVGFAQPWIVHPRNGVYKRLKWHVALRYRLKYFLQKLFFARADYLIVEHGSVRERLLGLGLENIFVVSNVVSSVFFDDSIRAPLESPIPRNKYDYVLGYIDRPYLHKNMEFLKPVGEILKEKYELNVAFLLTLEEDEMQLNGFDRADYYTVGTISSLQCPEFYNAIDGLFFPTLLECFSVSP